MVKYIEKAGIPAVHICAITNISETVGANRIVPAVAIPHPTGNPNFSKEEEFVLRKKLIKKALEALETNIDKQTIFKGVKI